MPTAMANTQNALGLFSKPGTEMEADTPISAFVSLPARATMLNQANNAMPRYTPYWISVVMIRVKFSPTQCRLSSASSASSRSLVL